MVKQMKVLVSKEDSWKLDTSMFIIDGSWETGYVYDENIFFMVGVTTCYGEGDSSPVIHSNGRVHQDPVSTLRVMPSDSDAYGWEYDVDYIEDLGPLWTVRSINSYGYMFKP